MRKILITVFFPTYLNTSPFFRIFASTNQLIKKALAFILVSETTTF